VGVFFLNTVYIVLCQDGRRLWQSGDEWRREEPDFSQISASSPSAATTQDHQPSSQTEGITLLSVFMQYYIPSVSLLVFVLIRTGNLYAETFTLESHL